MLSFTSSKDIIGQLFKQVTWPWWRPFMG